MYYRNCSFRRQVITLKLLSTPFVKPPICNVLGLVYGLKNEDYYFR